MTTLDRTHGGPFGGGDGHEHEGSYLEGKGSTLRTIMSWVVTLDHKKIGVMYLFAEIGRAHV